MRIRSRALSFVALACLVAGQVLAQAAPAAQQQMTQQQAQEAARKAQEEALKNATLRVGDAAPPLKVRWIKGEKPVDFKDGKVHVLELALQDKLDPAAAEQTKANYRASMKRRSELQAAANAALQEGKPDEAIRLANEASAAVPVFANSQWPILYRAYKARSDAQAAAFVDTIAAEHSTAPIDLQELARAIGEEDPSSTLKLLQAATKHTLSTDVGLSMALAKAYARTGDYAKALAYQETAVRGLPKSSTDARMQQMIDSEHKALEEYRQKAGA